MYSIIWQYQVSPENIEKFEQHYSANGSWAVLFKKATGYLGTELLRDENVPNRFITIDRWESKKSHEAFMTEWGDEYGKMDKRCEGLATVETLLGKFTSE